MKSKDFLLKTIITIFIPILITYTGYIQSYGEDSPGGGFQSGMVISYSFIIYKIFFKNKKINLSFFLGLSFFGVFLYFFVGLISVFCNGYFLDYLYFVKNNTISRHIGIFLVELGVFITVFSTMTSIFLIFYEFIENK